MLKYFHCSGSDTEGEGTIYSFTVESCMSNRNSNFDFTRREAVVAGGGFIGMSIVARRAAMSGEFSLEDVEEAEIEKQGLQYFTIEQAEIVQNMANRIYPSDENGPGAPEAGVVYFIDRQMNQDWGQGERWYMEGPFPGYEELELDTGVEEATPIGGPVGGEGVGEPAEHDSMDEAEGNDTDEDDDSNGSEAEAAREAEEHEGDPEDPEETDVEVEWADEEPAEGQGWQQPLTPAQAYTYSIDFVEAYCEAEYGDGFVDLAGDEQDEVIQALQDDEVGTFRGLEPSDFFLLLRENTLEGMFADPMYGGNQEMIGWRLKNFPGTPGALGSFRENIQEEEYIEIDEPRSMADDVEDVGLNPDGEHDH
jgi:gluconate 2-dehydrogenase gamma chain